MEKRSVKNYSSDNTDGVLSAMKNDKLKNELYEKILSFHLKGEIIEKKDGTYGTVFIIDQGESVVPRYVAYKTIKSGDELEKGKLENFVREARKWFSVKGHSLILTPFFITYHQSIPLICMPYCEMDLQTYFEKRRRLELIETLPFAAQILKALMFAKGRGIEAHQDLKPANILLEDLSKIFSDFPSKDVHPSMRYRVRLADFGMANAWKELGKPQGSYPYMAPEQYAPNEYKRFCPDTFALGVMLAEMLTGKHPAGKETGKLWRDWNRKKWEQWAKSGERRINIGDDEISKRLERLIYNMLSCDPDERPSLDIIIGSIMNIIQEINKPTSDQLKLLFEYYDTWGEYQENENRLEALTHLSQLSGQLDIVINELLEDFSKTEKCLNDSRSVVYFCRLCCITSKLLLKRDKIGDREKVEQLAKRIISEACKWGEQIKTHHKYPEIRFKDRILLHTPPFKDFEVFAEIVGDGGGLLENVIGEDNTRKYFENMDNYTRAAYWFSKASNFHSQGDEEKALKILDNCIELRPKEPTLYYMKALWTEHHLIKVKAIGKLKSTEKDSLVETIIRNAQEALLLDPHWEEPNKLRERIRWVHTI